jgi:trehalose 6-phosphate synthase
VNRTFGTGTWQPLVLNLDSNFLAAVAAYTEYDVLFVNPVADGMNLVSKEGPLVNERDGVVVLSDQAGSFNELAGYVSPIDPFDIGQQADALYEALHLEEERRAARASLIRQQVTVHDVQRWIEAQLADIATVQNAATATGAR